MPKNKIKLMLVDDQRLMRDGLRTLMELEPDIEVIAEAQNGEQACTIYAEKKPNVVLMDIRMPVMDGVEATRQILKSWPEALIIILTTFDDDHFVFEGLRAGALGYLLKDVSGSELAEAIRTVVNGGALIGPSIARKMVAEFARLAPLDGFKKSDLVNPLSNRELDILRLLSKGMSNKEIATHSHLAEGTVKNYVSSILTKFGASDRTHLILKAKEIGLI
jgi:DNA-binding NarL/FixJ family response regulator